jgi:hypothetical protein
MRLARRHLVLALAALAGATMLVGCSLPPFPTRTPPGPVAQAPTAVPATPTACVGSAGAYPVGQPYPCPSPVTPIPPITVHSTIDGLPPGAVADVAQAWRWLGESDQTTPNAVATSEGSLPARVVDYVPLKLADGSADLAVVVSDRQSSRAIWLFSRDLAPRLTVSPAIVATSFRQGIDAGQFFVDEANRTWLALMTWHQSDVPVADDVTFEAMLPEDGSTLLESAGGESVSVTDWSGDGVPDQIVSGGTVVQGTPVAAMELFLGAGKYVASRGPVATLVPPAALMDAVGDSAPEVVAPSGTPGTWLVNEWNGTSFVPAPPIQGSLATPAPVEAGAMPPLPADLFFLRDGHVWRWPRVGGAIMQVTDEVQSTKMSPEAGAGAIYDYHLAADGRHIVYPVEVYFQGSQGSTERTDLVVRDLGTGNPTVVVEDVWPGDYYEGRSGYGIAPDGRWVVYLAAPEPQSKVANSGPTGAPAGTQAAGEPEATPQVQLVRRQVPRLRVTQRPRSTWWMSVKRQPATSLLTAPERTRTAFSRPRARVWCSHRTGGGWPGRTASAFGFSTFPMALRACWANSGPMPRPAFTARCCGRQTRGGWSLIQTAMAKGASSTCGMLRAVRNWPFRTRGCTLAQFGRTWRGLLTAAASFTPEPIRGAHRSASSIRPTRHK